MRPLTTGQRKFVAAFMQSGDPTAAAEQAGYGSAPRVAGFKLMRSPAVRAALDAEREHLAAHVLAYLDSEAPPIETGWKPTGKLNGHANGHGGNGTGNGNGNGNGHTPPVAPPPGRPPAPPPIDLSNVDELARRIACERARIAFADIRQVAAWTGEGIHLFPSDELPADLSAAISEVKETKQGLAVKMHDKLAALDALCRQFGIGVEHGQGGDKTASLILQIIGLEAAPPPPPANSLDGGPLIDLVAVG